MLDVGDIFSELHVTGSRHILKFHILSKKNRGTKWTSI